MLQKSKIKQLFNCQEKSPVYIICELSINHGGNLDIALSLINAAASAGVDAVKFQKRDLDSIYPKELLDNPSLAEWNFDYLIPILKEVEFGWDDYLKIKKECNRLKLEFIITPFDLVSATFCEKLKPDAFKVASADMVNYDLLSKLASYNRPIIISTGMWLLPDIDKTVKFLNYKLNVKNFGLLLCNSTYPTPFEDVGLKILENELYNNNIKGYSGHERGIFIPVAAVALGAKIIEKHITFDKTQKGPDHKASLLPEEFKQMVSDIRNLELSLTTKKSVNQAETLNKEVFAKSATAVWNYKVGDKLKKHGIIYKSPGKGIFPHQIDNYINKKLQQPVTAGEYITKEHFEQIVEFKDWQTFNFKKRWGIKCRFHDYHKHQILKSPVVEFHCSQTDIENNDYNDILKSESELIIHAPEIVDRDIIDFCSDNPDLIDRSVNLIQKTIDKSILMNKKWKSDRPKLVIHIGGMFLNKNGADMSKLIIKAIKNFSKLKWNDSEIEILPENLPPRPWYLGGEWHQYGFIKSTDFMQFCNYFNFGMTYDICHAQLYCNHVGINQAEYAEQVKSYVRHLHISDAMGINGEGIQIGEGMLDFNSVLSVLSDIDYSWVTEIWSGHLHHGVGMYRGLQKLDKKYKHLL